MSKIVTKKSLIIVESPAKCKKIESILGPGYKCIASFGHLRNIPDLKSIDIENGFAITYSIIQEAIKLKQIEKIRKEITDADEVILASDDDREGESIAWHICQLFSLPVATTKRIIFHEITEPSILSAIIHPRTVNMDLVQAQQSRQVLDLLVGFNITPLLWNNIAKQHKTSLSAGRCQTPALRLVYENYLDIQASPGQLVYNVSGYFTNLNLLFDLNKQISSKEDVKQFLEYCASPDIKYVCNVSSPKKVIKKAPEPLTTSTLQQLASNELHMSPKETMKYAQQLYESGYITYMRTDVKKYSKDFIEKTTKHITTTYGLTYVSQTLDNITLDLNEVNNKKEELEAVTTNKKIRSKQVSLKDNIPKPQGAHEAIRPVSITTRSLTLDNSTSDLQAKAVRLYDLIWTRSLESCMPSAQYTAVVATINLEMKNKELTNKNEKDEKYKDHHFTYKAEQVVFPGWQIVTMKQPILSETKESKESKEYNYFIHLKQGLTLIYKKIEAKTLLKDLKSHYTEARLVQLLEEKGIGRPSTFASIIDKIIERKYVEKQNVEGKQVECIDFVLDDTNKILETISKKEFGNEKGKLVIQPLGVIVIEFLLKHFPTFFEYSYTKDMEDELDKIASGQGKWTDVCSTCHNDLTRIIDGLKDLKKFEIQIDNEYSIIIGKYGPVIKFMDSNETKKEKDKIKKNATFIPVKKSLDIKMLLDFEEQNGRQLTLDDVMDKAKSSQDSIGKYKGQDLFIKNGRYGIYAQWGTNMKSLKELDKPIDKLEYLEVLTFLEKDNLLDPSKPVGLVRELSSNLSIRTGKFGDYIFYKKPRAKKPEFLKLNGFKDDYKSCDKGLILNWIKQTYNAE
jgi:DNA topoisomerase I